MTRRITLALFACAGLALACERERPDATVNAAVLARLEREPALPPGQVAARTEEGHVILSGQVATPEQRRLAEHVAGAVGGVKGVTNEIQIDVSAPPPASVPPPSSMPDPPAPSTDAPAPSTPEDSPR